MHVVLCVVGLVQGIYRFGSTALIVTMATGFGLMLNEAAIMQLVSDLKDITTVLLKHKVRVAAGPTAEYEKHEASVPMVDQELK